MILCKEFYVAQIQITQAKATVTLVGSKPDSAYFKMLMIWLSENPDFFM